MIDDYLSITPYHRINNNFLKDTNDIFYPTVELCNVIINLKNKFKLMNYMEMNDNSGITSSVLHKVSNINGVKWDSFIAIENYQYNNIINYFPVLKNKINCLDIYKQNNVILPDIIVNSALVEKIDKTYINDLLTILKNNIPIVIYYFSVSNKTFFDEFRNNKSVDNYYIFERYVKIYPKFKCPSNLSKKIPLFIYTIFFVKKDLMITRNRWKLESQFDDIIGLENIFDMPILFVNDNLIMQYYNYAELLDNIRTYDGNEPKTVKDIYKYLSTGKEIPNFIKNEIDYDKFMYLSKKNIYPYTISNLDELDIFYNKIKILDSNDLNLEEYIKENDLPLWIKKKEQLGTVLMFLEFSKDKSIFISEKTTREYYAKLLTTNGKDIRKFN